ncbi:MAG: type II toxin-antitoxin system RelE/ParE family toxin [Treponema sp.]|jgi:addiction module RelE/StbE family toxin|nr:type II toxin-antitoxin system RelE/ParE family toxin [Treponema sp.]
MKYKLKFLESAKDDKEEIKKYLNRYYPGTVKNFIKKLKNCIENIEETPYMYPKYEYYPNYRKAVVGNYLVFYKANEENKTVEIQRILPGMWNLARYFESNNGDLSETTYSDDDRQAE